MLFDWSNFKSYKTPRKIVVFESDDWGSIRMPSRGVYDTLINEGYRIASRPFERFDSIETEKDIDLLFDVLRRHRDIRGNHPIFTANMIMTNPDFKRIRDSDFIDYHSESFTDTYKKKSIDSLARIKTGIHDRLFFPQYHGREHFSIKRWMEALQSNNPETRFSFDMGMVGIPPKMNPELGNVLLITLSMNEESELPALGEQLEQGLEIFHNTFGYQSESFIAPVYTWHSSLEKNLEKAGIKFIQGAKFQIVPAYGKVKRKRISHYTGQRNSLNQLFLVRNVYFEPAASPSKDIVDETLKYIGSAFTRKHPAIISTHRLNYMGGIDEGNRSLNLKLLDQLLRRILATWKDVEFMTSVELGNYINQDIDGNKRVL